MREQEKEVRTYLVRAMCTEPVGGVEGPRCNGEYLPTGICLQSYRAQYPHVCNKCGHKATFYSRPYPRTELR